MSRHYDEKRGSESIEPRMAALGSCGRDLVGDFESSPIGSGVGRKIGGGALGLGAPDGLIW